MPDVWQTSEARSCYNKEVQKCSATNKTEISHSCISWAWCCGLGSSVPRGHSGDSSHGLCLKHMASRVTLFTAILPHRKREEHIACIGLSGTCYRLLTSSKEKNIPWLSSHGLATTLSPERESRCPPYLTQHALHSWECHHYLHPACPSHQGSLYSLRTNLNNFLSLYGKKQMSFHYLISL